MTTCGKNGAGQYTEKEEEVDGDHVKNGWMIWNLKSCNAKKVEVHFQLLGLEIFAQHRLKLQFTGRKKCST